MLIQWFPGHMTKALREMQESIKLIDAVLYVLDARCPYACLNPEFQKLIGNKPCMFVLNKADLADEAKLQMWRAYFSKFGIVTDCVASQSKSRGKLLTGLQKTLTEFFRKNEAKQIRKNARCMVLGVPNSGKSTVINCLCQSKRAVTGDKPGVTKGKQWVRLAEGLELLDTPGTLWPSFADQGLARHLAYVGSIKDDILDVTELAAELLSELMQLYPKETALRYDLQGTKDLLLQVCDRKHCIGAGGVPDELRAAKMVLDDFRKGKIARITLEVPSSAE